jgi:hypothetical protein
MLGLDSGDRKLGASGESRGRPSCIGSTMCESFELTEGFLFMFQELWDRTEPTGLVMYAEGE